MALWGWPPAFASRYAERARATCASACWTLRRFWATVLEYDERACARDCRACVTWSFAAAFSDALRPALSEARRAFADARVRLRDRHVEIRVRRVGRGKHLAGLHGLARRGVDGGDRPRGAPTRRARGRARSGARRRGRGDGRRAAERERVGRGRLDGARRGHLLDDVRDRGLAREVLRRGRPAEARADDRERRGADPDDDEQAGADRLPAHGGSILLSARREVGSRVRSPPCWSRILKRT